MALKPEQLTQIKDAFNQWASNNANPKKPSLEFISGKKANAQKIAQDIEKIVDGTAGRKEDVKAGKHILHMIDVYVASGNTTLEEILSEITTPEPPVAATPTPPTPPKI